ncbi:MAG: VOC family protein [Opitutaceae bacterium]|jgi:predicted enzyme related to lactoylglutathione lyase|nr:VOC family protein [Opitutaceae bacterium]
MSIGVKEIAYSVYAVSDFDRALAFYQDVIGLTLTFSMPEGDGPRWAEFDVGGAALCIGKTADWKPSTEGCTVALEVEDFEGAITKLRAADVKITMEPMDTGVCEMAGIADPDGNPLLIHKRKPQPASS